MKEVLQGYLWTFEFDDIDNDKLYTTCLNVEEDLKRLLPPIPTESHNGYGCFTSYYHKHYNLFSYPCSELNKLYTNLCKTLHTVMFSDKQYYMRSWVNLFDTKKNIDWHSHWKPEYQSYHGFYCVNTEGKNKSYTDYKIPNVADTYRIMSRDGRCVFGKSDGDQHRSSEWLNDDKYRVTIAFDIIPVGMLRTKEEFTHTLESESYLHNFIPLAKL